MRRFVSRLSVESVKHPELPDGFEFITNLDREFSVKKYIAVKKKVAESSEFINPPRSESDERKMFDTYFTGLKTSNKRVFIFIYDKEKNQLCAFASLTINVDPTTDKLTLYVGLLGTDPDYRGKGFATAILDYARAEAKHNSAQAIGLDVDDNNKYAFQFYKNYGMRILETFTYHRMEIPTS